MNQEISLRLTVDQTNLVIGALMKAPYEAVADVIALIRSQAIAQLQPPETPEAAGGAD